MIFQGHPHPREMAALTLPEEHYRDIYLSAISRSPGKGQGWGWAVKVGRAGLGQHFSWVTTTPSVLGLQGCHFQQLYYRHHFVLRRLPLTVLTGTFAVHPYVCSSWLHLWCTWGIHTSLQELQNMEIMLTAKG